MVHALLLDSKEEVREKQFAWLRSHTEPLVYRDVVGFQKIIASLDPRMRLPLIDLAVPALTHLSDAQYEVFIENVKNLIQADERVSLFEYAVQSLLVRHLTPKFKGPIWDSVKYADLGEVQAECGVLISALAHAGGAGRTRPGNPSRPPQVDWGDWGIGWSCTSGRPFLWLRSGRASVDSGWLRRKPKSS